MTYQELKLSLEKCERSLKSIQDGTYKNLSKIDVKETTAKLKVLKESLTKQLKEVEKGTVTTDDENTAKKLSDQGVPVNLTKEQEGIRFSKEETMAIAKDVGKAAAKALNDIGDEVAHMKAKDISEGSFEIYVEYKNDSDDQFSFYISDDTLHLVDFSFDKELVDVGVKPSGEAIVHVDVLANELVKHFNAMQEGMSDQEYADAKEADRLEKHPEKDTIKKIQALIAAQKPKTVKEVVKTTSWSRYKKLKDRGVSVQFVTKDELNPPENRSNTPKVKEASSEEEEKFHKKLDTLVHKTFGKREDEMNEAPEGMYYIKVAVRDARKALAIIDDQPALRNAVEIDGSDTYYLSDEELAYDLLQDFLAQDIEVTDNNIELEEATDYQRRREAESDYKVSKKDKPAKAYKEPKNDYFARRKAEMDEESISTHDPHLAQAILDLIDSHAATAGLTDEEAKEEIIDFLRKQKVDEDAKERVARAAAAAKALSTKVAFGKFDTEHGEMDKGKSNLRKYIARPGSLEEDDIDVGHQDDEPSMLKQQVYDIATYAAKLYKILDKYDQMDAEVDFPHWWQSKVILARDYVSAAQHYLEFEEKQPALDQLALEEGIDETSNANIDPSRHATNKYGQAEKFKSYRVGFQGKDPYSDDSIENLAKKKAKTRKGASAASLKKEYDELVAKMKQLAKHFKTAEGEKKAKIVAALKQHTARKRELESQIDKAVAGIGSDQELAELFGPKVSYDEIIGGIIKRFHELKKYVSKKEPDAMDDLHQVLRAFEIFDEKMAYGAHEELEEALDPQEWFANRHKAHREALLQWMEKDSRTKGKEVVDLDHVMNEIIDAWLKDYRFGNTMKGYLDDEKSRYGFWRAVQAQSKGELDEAEAKPIPGQILRGYNQNVKNAQSMAQALLSMFNQINSKESFDFNKHSGIKRVLNMLDKIAKTQDTETPEAEINEDHTDNPNDKYVVRPCKNKKEPWAVWEGEKRVKGFAEKKDAQAFADKKNKEQGLNEAKATCCGKCGRVHVKGSECKRPFLKGKDHCRYN